MKKFIAVLAVFSLMIIQGIPVFSAERELSCYTVAVTTYDVTEVDGTVTQIVGDVRIHHIIISNDDPTEAQTVSFYELSDSTTTITLDFAVDIASTSSSGLGYTGPVQIPFPIPASPYVVHDLCVRKSSLASTVRVTVFYR